MQFDFDEFSRSGTAPIGSKFKINSLGGQGSTKHRPKTRDVVDSIGECNLTLQMDRLSRLTSQDGRAETSFIDGSTDHSKDIIRLNLNRKETVTDRKMRASDRLNNWTDDCKVIDKVLQSFSDNSNNSDNNNSNYNVPSRQFPTNVIPQSNNVNPKINNPIIRSKTPSSVTYMTNSSMLYSHQSRPVSHQSTIKPTNSINATSVLAPYLEGNFSSNTNSLLKSKRKMQINKKKESQKSSGIISEYANININRDRPNTTSNAVATTVAANDNQRKVYQPPNTATQVPIERPQSRKLYLGSAKQGSNTSRPMRSASSVVVGANNTDDHPNLRRLSSFNGFVNTSWQDDTFPHRPPSRQSSAFPIDLADAKSMDNEISGDDSIVEICSDDDSIVEEIEAKVNKLTCNSNSRRGSPSALKVVNDPVLDGFLDFDTNHVPFRIEINYSAVHAISSTVAKNNCSNKSSSTIRRPSNSYPTSIFNYSSHFNENNSQQLERSKSLRSTTNDKKSPPSVFNYNSPSNQGIADVTASDSDDDIEILSDTCEHVTPELTLETSLGEDFLNLFAPSSPSRW